MDSGNERWAVASRPTGAKTVCLLPTMDAMKPKTSTVVFRGKRTAFFPDLQSLGLSMLVLLLSIVSPPECDGVEGLGRSDASIISLFASLVQL
ncbi:hypothetical protein BJY01DRAFT_223378 [Aspergillus pseudoustus]|uniref:Uncharacterized protein n=1 Tax=Aspergillus pseudoustus TaxID=1810923 RepID=A0ABR4J7P2_9EURO